MEVKTMSLRRRASVVAALACALWSFDASADVSLRVDAQPVSDPIQVWVSVTSSGSPVTGLQAGDFTVSVDGTQVSSPTFSLPPSGGGGNVSVVLAMDMSQTVQNAALESMQQAVIQFIDSMQSGDYAAIVKFNNTNPEKASVVQDFTRIDDGGAGDTALKGAVMAPYPGSGSNILDAVDLSIGELRSPSVTLPSGSKAIVLVSDGRDNASTTTFDAVVADASSAGVRVFTIGVGDLTTSGARMLDNLANETGGDYFPAPNNSQIADAYQQIANRLSNEYLLKFDSTITDCSSHNLQVQVTGHGSDQTSFQRCTSGGGGGGGDDGGGDGGGGGGGGSTGLLELVLGVALAVGFARRRRARYALL